MTREDRIELAGDLLRQIAQESGSDMVEISFDQMGDGFVASLHGNQHIKAGGGKNLSEALMRARTGNDQ